jgi:hypothetical protein
MSGVKITRAMQHDKILCISYTISWILGTFCLKLFWYKALALNACKKAETFLRTWRISFVQEIPAGTGAASQSPKQSEGAELEEQYGVWTGWHQHCIPHTWITESVPSLWADLFLVHASILPVTSSGQFFLCHIHIMEHLWPVNPKIFLKAPSFGLVTAQFAPCMVLVENPTNKLYYQGENITRGMRHD